jgi:hypothetical protein
VHPVLLAFWRELAGQLVHALTRKMLEYVPFGHAVHTVVNPNVPGAQPARQVVCPVADVKVPAEQRVQVCCAIPVLKVPMAQAVHADCPVKEEKVPGEQDAHTVCWVVDVN